MAKVSDSGLEDYLASARDMSNGTMPMTVVVENHQIDDANKWLKGKRKVKELTLMTRSDHDALKKSRK